MYQKNHKLEDVKSGLQGGSGAYYSDFFLYCFCPCCAMAQDVRELNAIDRRQQQNVRGGTQVLVAVQPPDLLNLDLGSFQER
jgi:hypothetical protein